MVSPPRSKRGGGHLTFTLRKHFLRAIRPLTPEAADVGDLEAIESLEEPLRAGPIGVSRPATEARAVQ